MCRLHVQDSNNKDSDDEEVYKNEDDKLCLCQDRLQAIYREESKLKDEIVYRILNGETDTMKPNSDETTQIHESHISLKFYTGEEREYLVLEWNGHIMRYTYEHGFVPEYVYGNYFQRIVDEEPPYV
ncbi:uncharacterized protein LOC131614733 [Vicia villosa]|uniref:uncharacterized protein LOC131614733 n=1 Tax=Vicia villosa TaxID=3911 RepID=UPI00273A96BE|nr:uncharacterized protein LOC131614733 [Vicia villosa]